MNTTIEEKLIGWADHMVTVWEFVSVDGTQRVLGIRPAHPDDYKYQHEYQRIVYRGSASAWRKGAA